MHSFENRQPVINCGMSPYLGDPMLRIDGAYLYDFGSEMQKVASLKEEDTTALDIYIFIVQRLNQPCKTWSTQVSFQMDFAPSTNPRPIY
jgi:hypothetical protein